MAGRIMAARAAKKAALKKAGALTASQAIDRAPLQMLIQLLSPASGVLNAVNQLIYGQVPGVSQARRDLAQSEYDLAKREDRLIPLGKRAVRIVPRPKRTYLESRDQ